MKSSRNLSEMTETERTGFPLLREWRDVGSWEWRGAGFRADGFVIPAQAGIQTLEQQQYSKIIWKSEILDSHFCGNDGSVATVTVRFRLCWNFGKLMNRHSRAGGNLEFQCLKNLSEKTKTLPPSFPRKWESRNEKQQAFIGNDRNWTDWIPAFAGMTVQLLRLLSGFGSVATVTVRFRLCWNFGKLMNRHSRAGGNLDRSVRKLIG